MLWPERMIYHIGVAFTNVQGYSGYHPAVSVSANGALVRICAAVLDFRVLILTSYFRSEFPAPSANQLLNVLVTWTGAAFAVVQAVRSLNAVLICRLRFDSVILLEKVLA